MQKLTIEGIESKITNTGNTKVVLVCKEGKFYFYRNTKTGISKAQEQFNKYGFTIGNVVEAEVQTEDKTFTNQKGDEITYKDNWIKFFGEVENAPILIDIPENEGNASQFNFDTNKRILDIEETIKKMRVAFLNHESRIHDLETPIIDIPGFEGTTENSEKVNIDFPEGFLQTDIQEAKRN